MEVYDATKVRLLEAAGEEFAAKGLEASRVRAICERAGANIAAINYHFGDKEQLYVAAVLDAHHCGAAANTDEPEGATPAEQLRAFIRHFLCHVLAVSQPDDWRHQLLLREMLHPTAASDVLIREIIRPRFERLSAILRQICPATDERKSNALAFSVIGQCLHYRMARPVTVRLIGPEAYQSLDLDFLTDHISGFCLAALGCVPPLNEAGETESAESLASR
jgi:TetR/AcrR family transcriptional regulator, regulator of cefoperazone and chloramphenicol sensitivity